MRRDAREISMRLVFSYLFSKTKDLELLSELEHDSEFKLTEEDMILADELYEGVIEHMEELKGIVEKDAIGFKSERVFKTDMAILLVALYEIKFREDIPPKVSANEAVELAKKYGSEKSASFVNGVIATVLKEQV